MARIRIAALGAALMIASAAAGAQDPHDKHSSSESHGARGLGRGANGLLRNIKLSEQQKAQIKTIHAKYRDQYTSQRGNGQKGDSAWGRRRDGQRPDSAQIAQRRAAMQTQMAQNRQIRQQEMAEIRNVLTVDQRVTFDRNVSELQAKMQDRADKDRGEGKGHGKKRGHKVGR